MYLKKVEAHGRLLSIPTNLELGDEYFSFADSINAAADKRSAAAAALEASVMAELQAEANMRGVTLGWLLREGCDHDSGSDSSDAAAEAAAADGGDGGCGGDATGHHPCGKATRRGRAKGPTE